MSLRADQLRDGGGTQGAVKKIIREQLHMIDAKLQQMERSWGRNTILIELDQFFSIDGLSKADQQRIVYSSVIKSLKERGYEVRLNVTETKTTLCVAWNFQVQEAYRQAMNKLLKECQISSDQMEAFCQGSLPPK